MDSCDVVIVGGGPAGSSCAWTLRKAGIESLILDAADLPRTKLCAGWITPTVIRDLEIDLSSYPHSLVELRKIQIEYFSRKAVRRWTLRTRQYSIRRFEFDHWLLQRSGARFEKHKVCKIRKEGNCYILDDRFVCKFLVGAAGTHCPVRRTFFPDSSLRVREFQVGTLEEEFYYPQRDDSCRLWFAENGLPGYSWIVPKGNGWVNVGLGAFCQRPESGAASLNGHWHLFTRKLADLGLVRGHSFSPGGYTYYVRSPAVAGQREACYLTGDAAGLATRDLAEGIGPAVESGIRAAHAIASGESYSLRGLTRYSCLSRGWPTRLAETLLDRDGGFFRDVVYGRNRNRRGVESTVL